jgi:hypothetical protein
MTILDRLFGTFDGMLTLVVGLFAIAVLIWCVVEWRGLRKL